MKVSKNKIDDVEVLTGENDHLKFVLAPGAGGKILSVYNKSLQKEFLWSNKNLRLESYQPGTDYDTNFWGGIDELIPNDIPEKVDSNEYPDHGELWTTPLEYELHDDKIAVFGKLNLCGLQYKKEISLMADSPEIVLDYTIRNDSADIRHFMWKLHAALEIEPGDKLVSSASIAREVYPELSKDPEPDEFSWPIKNGSDVSVVPPRNNSLDFFYLYDVRYAEMQFMSAKGQHCFSYKYDKKVFPFQWYFASYGKFLDHYTAILEPSSSMPVSVNEAMAMGQCTMLQPGQEINTRVTIYAGKNKDI